MSEIAVPKWLLWAREIQSLCQTGLAYSASEYETGRYKRLLEIAAEMVETYTGLDQDRLINNFSAQPGYATAKIDVRGAIIKDEKILLVQERKDHHWAMPGGWADVGEVPSDMVAREVVEESGFVVEPKKIIGVYDANRAPVHLEFFHAYKIIFLCEITGGQPCTSDETMDVGFFPFDKLPPLSLYRTNERHLEEVLAHHRDKGRPAAFD